VTEGGIVVIESVTFVQNLVFTVYDSEAEYVAGNSPLQTKMYNVSCSNSVQVNDVIGDFTLVAYEDTTEGLMGELPRSEVDSLIAASSAAIVVSAAPIVVVAMLMAF
jgi:hypothetical protein